MLDPGKGSWLPGRLHIISKKNAKYPQSRYLEHRRTMPVRFRFQPMRFASSLLYRFSFLIMLVPVYSAAGAADAGFERIYSQNCAVCHGEQGDGRSRAQSGLNPPPRDFTSPEAAKELDRDRMIRSVTFGRPGTAMVPWGHRLTSEQIAGVVDYIRERFMQPVADAAPVPSAGGAHGVRTPAATVRAVAGTASRGEIVYRSHCATCHGEDGSGASWAAASMNPPPRDFTSAATRAALTRERMMNSVKNGRPGTAMMSFAARIDDGDIAAVVDYIRQRFMADRGAAVANPHAHAAVAATVDMAAPFAGGRQGSAERGAAIYSANCIPCHGAGGDGRGPRSSFIHPPPRDFLATESRRTLNRPALFAAVAEGKRGTVMPAWKTVLDEEGIADVAEYVYQEFIAPASRADEKKKRN